MRSDTRDATLADFSAIQALMHENDVYHVKLKILGLNQNPLPITQSEYLSWLDKQKKEKGLLIVTSIRGAVVGVLLAEYRTPTPGDLLDNGPYVHIRRVVTQEGLRGKGIGKGLMRRAVKWAREKECSSIELNVFEQNKNAIRFYKEKNSFYIRQHTMRRDIRRRPRVI